MPKPVGRPTESVKLDQFSMFFFHCRSLAGFYFKTEMFFHYPSNHTKVDSFLLNRFCIAESTTGLSVLSSSGGSFSWTDIVFISVYFVL